MKVAITKTGIPEVLLIQHEVFQDERGFFAETFKRSQWEKLGGPVEFVQDNHSRSTKGVLRGFHFQDLTAPMGKLVRCARGEILDVALDLRVGSPTFGTTVSEVLSDKKMNQLYIPPGFGHAFLTLSEIADVQYKCTGEYSPEAERSIVWNDPDVAFDWNVESPIVSTKDAAAESLKEYIKNPAFRSYK